MTNVRCALDGLKNIFRIWNNSKHQSVKNRILTFIALMLSYYINDWLVCLVCNTNSVSPFLIGNVFWQGRCGSAQLLQVFSGAFTEGEGSCGAPAGVSKHERRPNTSTHYLGLWIYINLDRFEKNALRPR